MGSKGSLHLPLAPLAERELSPQALSNDLIFSYCVEGCIKGCMRDYIIKYFPLTLSPQARAGRPRRPRARRPRARRLVVCGPPRGLQLGGLPPGRARSHCRFVLLEYRASTSLDSHTRFTNIFGTSIPEMTMRPNPTRRTCSCSAPPRIRPGRSSPRWRASRRRCSLTT